MIRDKRMKSLAAAQWSVLLGILPLVSAVATVWVVPTSAEARQWVCEEGTIPLPWPLGVPIPVNGACGWQDEQSDYLSFIAGPGDRPRERDPSADGTGGLGINDRTVSAPVRRR